MADEDWQRLADYVIGRRVDLGYESRERFATVAGLSARVLSDLEKARRPVALATLAAVESALQWKPGSARMILAGDEPVPAGDELSQARAQQRRHFADPALQRVYDAAEGLPESDRLNLVALAEAMRARQKDA